MILTLPAGNFTAMVAGSGGTTGVALIEATDLRNNATILLNRAAGAPGGDEVLTEFTRDLRAAAADSRLAAAKPTGRPEPEFCVAPLTGAKPAAPLAQIR